MLLQTIRSVMTRVEAVLVGYKECRGVFRVTDQDGHPLSGVEVCYRVGDTDWIPCGRSRDVRSVNFSQPKPFYYSIGEPVAWQFSRPGFKSVTVTRYTAGTDFDEELCTVIMSRCSNTDTLAALRAPLHA